MSDLFATQLEECSFRGVGFPIQMVSEKGGQRIAIHHKMDRAGAQVESTGRLPFSFSVRAYFIDGLTPGANEQWSARDLFPAGWIQMRDYMNNGSTGTFTHPLYGDFQCKPVSYTVDFSADVRNGVIVDLEFIETIDESQETVVLQPTVITSATSSALNLDTQLLNPITPPPYMPDMGGYSSYSNAITGILGMGQVQGVNKIDNLTNSLYAFGDALNISDQFVAAFSDVTYEFIDALNTLKLQFQFTQANTSIYTVAKETTLANIANTLKNSLTQIIELNPFLVAVPVIRRETQVAYYTQ